MKRTRRAGSQSSKSSEPESPFGFAKPEPPPTWTEVTVGKADEMFKPYSMSAAYARGDLVLHPKFGKGVVTMVEPQRVEVLFEDASRKLGLAVSN